jgi:hypothetical protein
MMIAVIGIGVALVPMVMIVGMLLLATRIQRAREEAVAHQIGVTDAIHRRFGPVVAPVVKRRCGGRWRAVIPVPFSQPAVVAGVVELAERTLAEVTGGRAGVEILLIAQPASAPLARRCVRHLISQQRGGPPLAA